MFNMKGKFVDDVLHSCAMSGVCWREAFIGSNATACLSQRGNAIYTYLSL